MPQANRKHRAHRRHTQRTAPLTGIQATSKALIESGLTPTRLRVLALIAFAERGATDTAIANVFAKIGETAEAIRAHRSALQCAGLIENPRDTQRLPIVREEPGLDRPQRVWVATPAGRAAVTSGALPEEAAQ